MKLDSKGIGEDLGRIEEGKTIMRMQYTKISKTKSKSVFPLQGKENKTKATQAIPLLSTYQRHPTIPQGHILHNFHINLI